jgi:AraC-like DNA-binding protein
MRRLQLDTDRDPGPGVAISSFSRDYAAESHVAEHAHHADQLMFATRGVMEVSAGRSYWLIPPQFAVWMPSRTAHRIRMASAVSMRTLYLRPGLARGLPRRCTVLHVNPLLRELIVEAVRMDALTMKAPLHAALRHLIVAELAKAQSIPTLVTMPHDARALRVAQAFMADPAGHANVARLCRRCLVTPRTVQRLFLRDVGTSFEVWRRQVRLMKGLELLMEGHSVTSVALSLGYQQPNAFITLFRETLGSTPRAWVSRLKDLS